MIRRANLTHRAASRLGASRMTYGRAAIAKAFVSEALLRASTTAGEFTVGYRHTAEYEIGRIVRDAIGSIAYSGTSETQHNVVASWLWL